MSLIPSWLPKSPKTLSRTDLLHVSMFMEFSGINYIVSTVSLIALSHHSVAKNPWSNQHKKWWTRGTWIGCFQRVRKTRTKRSTWILSTHPWRGVCLEGPDDFATHGGRDFERITWTNEDWNCAMCQWSAMFSVDWRQPQLLLMLRKRIGDDGKRHAWHLDIQWISSGRMLSSFHQNYNVTSDSNLFYNFYISNAFVQFSCTQLYKFSQQDDWPPHSFSIF